MIVGLQSGHYGALESLVNKHSPTEKSYKNQLWALFKSASTQIRLHSQLDSIIRAGLEQHGDKQELDDYHSLYTELMDTEDCKALKRSLSQVAHPRLNFDSGSGHLPIDAITEQLGLSYSKFSWVEKI